jgi:hypothetical protein
MAVYLKGDPTEMLPGVAKGMWAAISNNQIEPITKASLQRRCFQNSKAFRIGSFPTCVA